MNSPYATIPNEELLKLHRDVAALLADTAPLAESGPVLCSEFGFLAEALTLKEHALGVELERRGMLQ